MIYFQDDFTDYDNNKIKVRWTKKLWDDHLSKHPEIRTRKNAAALIAGAITKPSLVLKGRKKDTKRELIRCYYKEHKRHQSDVYFTKVVVSCNTNPFYIKTVFTQWLFCDLVVQEKNYNHFKEIWRELGTYL